MSKVSTYPLMVPRVLVILSCIFQILFSECDYTRVVIFNSPLSPNLNQTLFSLNPEREGHDARDLASRVVESSLKEHNNPAN